MERNVFTDKYNKTSYEVEVKSVEKSKLTAVEVFKKFIIDEVNESKNFASAS